MICYRKMAGMEQISIITPIFNGSKNLGTISKNIQHLEESDLDYELLIVDDGSIRNERNKLRDWLSIQTSERIRLLQLDHNSGPGTARHKGLKECQKPYLIFLDSDDTINPIKLKNILTKITPDFPLDIVHTQFAVDNTSHKGSIQYEHSNSSFVGQLDNSKCLKDFLEFKREHSVLGCIFKTDTLRQCAHNNDNLFPSGYHEDALFWWELLIHCIQTGGKQLKTTELFYTKRSTQGSIINTISQKHIDGYINAWEKIMSSHFMSRDIDNVYGNSYAIGLTALIATRLREITRHSNDIKYSSTLVESLKSSKLSHEQIKTGLEILNKKGLKTQYAHITEEFLKHCEGRISAEQLIENVNALKSKRWSCQYIQDAIFFRSNEIRTCCKRFFVEGKRKGDVKLQIENLEELEYREIVTAKSKLTMAINSGESDQCTGCPFLEFREWKPVKSTKPKYISIENHSICNMRCTYCSEEYWGGKKPEYSLNRVVKSMAEGQNLDEVQMIVWGGGEPTLGPEFDKTFHLLSTTCPDATQRVITNASRYSEVIKHALATKNAQIITSIDAGNSKTFKQIRGNNLLEKVISNLQAYEVGNSRRITIKYILDEINSNDKELKEFTNLVASKGLKEVNFQISSNFKEERMPDNILEAGIKLAYFLRKEGCYYCYFDDLFIARLPKKEKMKKTIERLIAEDANIQKYLYAQHDEIIIWGAGQQSYLLNKHAFFMDQLSISCYIDDINTAESEVAFGRPFSRPDEINIMENNSICISAVQGYALIREKLSDMDLEKQISKNILI